MPDNLYQLTAGRNCAYDPGAGLLYQLLTQLEIPSLTQVYLAVLDINTQQERYRIPLEDSAAWVGEAQLDHGNPRQSDTSCVRHRSGGSSGVHRVYDTSTGQIVAQYDEVGTENIVWFSGLSLASTYVFVGYDHQTVSVGDELNAYGVVDIGAGIVCRRSHTGRGRMGQRGMGPGRRQLGVVLCHDGQQRHLGGGLRRNRHGPFPPHTRQPTRSCRASGMTT